jgi:hypothetical protein
MPLCCGSGGGGGVAGVSFSACAGGGGGAGTFSHFIEYTSSPLAVRPIGAQLSGCAAVAFGVNLVCAKVGNDVAGEATTRKASNSFFIGKLDKSFLDWPRQQQVYYNLTGVAAEYLAENFFDQEICSPLRDGCPHDNSSSPSLSRKARRETSARINAPQKGDQQCARQF